MSCLTHREHHQMTLFEKKIGTWEPLGVYSLFDVHVEFSNNFVPPTHTQPTQQDYISNHHPSLWHLHSAIPQLEIKLRHIQIQTKNRLSHLHINMIKRWTISMFGNCFNMKGILISRRMGITIVSNPSLGRTLRSYGGIEDEAPTTLTAPGLLIRIHPPTRAFIS